MRTTTLARAASLLLAATVAACSTDDPQTPGSGASVAVGDNFFNPRTLQVPVGSDVVWLWSGSLSHNVTFDNGDPGSRTQAGGSFRRTFTTAGDFDYYCTIHGAAVMSGTVVVEP